MSRAEFTPSFADEAGVNDLVRATFSHQRGKVGIGIRSDGFPDLGVIVLCGTYFDSSDGEPFDIEMINYACGEPDLEKPNPDALDPDKTESFTDIAVGSEVFRAKDGRITEPDGRDVRRDRVAELRGWLGSPKTLWEKDYSQTVAQYRLSGGEVKLNDLLE